MNWIKGDVLPTKTGSNVYYIVFFDSCFLICPVLCRWVNNKWFPVYQNNQGYNKPNQPIDEKVEKYALVE